MTALPITGSQGYIAVFKRAALWLVFLAPLFYLTYGFANWHASTRNGVGSVVYGWERHIPFLAWTIIPYWSINAFYGLSLFVNDSASGVNRLAGRYLTAQTIACLCFLLFPLAATFSRPETNGLPGFMFDVLGGFDKPFNQAPSLHIALLVIIWDHLRHRMPGWLRPVWHVWCVLIGASVMTTYQHHFIDIPTGALLGLFALWLFPAKGEMPFAGFRPTMGPKARRLGGFYLGGAVLLLIGAVVGAFREAAWLALLWPALALVIVSFGYFGGGPKVFQKTADGRVSLASRWLLWPYRAGALINVWAWTRKLAPSVEVADGVFLGRWPSVKEAADFATVIDLAAELERPARAEGEWVAFPMMDLVRPEATTKRDAAAQIEISRARGPVLVCCALGFQRSAGVVAGWLIDTGRAKDRSEVEALLAKAGRRVHLG
ncbi:MAG: phosphatase PAP2/dual specificity phosphatase family protein [Rhizobiaceae bacterium]|nr:phosphatase PAP2/dual specificity phosphatase family protein [Rhizobiaceae bacterium]